MLLLILFTIYNPMNKVKDLNREYDHLENIDKLSLPMEEVERVTDRMNEIMTELTELHMAWEEDEGQDDCWSSSINI